MIWGFLASQQRSLAKGWAWLIAAVLALIVGFSRIYLGVHFPWDVAAGWALGALALAAGLLILRSGVRVSAVAQGAMVLVAGAGAVAVLLLLQSKDAVGVAGVWIVHRFMLLALVPSPARSARHARLGAPTRALGSAA